jgi:uncharacterized membrane protein YidH (DUF202 family)
MENFGKRALPHLIGLLVYSAILRIVDKHKPSGGGMMILLAVFIVLHVFVCLFLALAKFSNHKSQEGRQYLLITLLVLIIGFGTCVSFFTLNVH